MNRQDQLVIQSTSNSIARTHGSYKLSLYYYDDQAYECDINASGRSCPDDDTHTLPPLKLLSINDSHKHLKQNGITVYSLIQEKKYNKLVRSFVVLRRFFRREAYSSGDKISD